MLKADKPKYDHEALIFKQRLTNFGMYAITALSVPLIVCILFFSGTRPYDHPLSFFSNLLLAVLLIAVTFFIKRIPLYVKRVMFISILVFFGIMAMYFVNLEFMTVVLVVLLIYVLLTSSKRTSYVMIVAILGLYLLLLILMQDKVLSFYHDPVLLHSETELVVFRVAPLAWGLGMVTVLILIVVENNKRNVGVLTANIEQISELNESLNRVIDDLQTEKLVSCEYAHSFLTLFNNSYDGFLILSEEFKILDINDAMLSLFGYSREELVNMNVFEVMSDDNRRAFEERRNKALKEDRLPDIVIDLRNKSNTRFVIQLQVTPVQGATAKTYLAIVKDVTSRQVASEELSKREQLYRTLFEQTNEAILIMNDKGIVDYNAVAKELYLQSDSKNVVPPYLDLDQEFSEPNDSVRLRERIDKVLAGDSQCFEWTHTYPDRRSSIYTMVNIKEIKALGPDYYMVVEKDVTDSKISQNLILNSIIHTEEKERQRISSDLHDGIGPLLTTIKLYAQALNDARDLNQEKKIKSRIIDLIEEAINSISEISFSISPHILQNHGVVAAIHSFIERFEIDKKYQINFIHDHLERLDDHKEITIYRMFTELINNTVKHAQATQVDFNIINHNNHIEMLYRDNGIGFDFNKAADKNTGMGLANFKNRIQSLHGTFTLATKPGRGIFLKIRIPKNTER